MNNIEKLDRMLEIRKQISADFKLYGSMEIDFMALSYAISDKLYEKEKLLTIRDYIKSRTNMFSIYRSNIIQTSMMLELNTGNPSEMFDRMVACHEIFKKNRYGSSYYLALANFALVSDSQVIDAESIVKKGKEVYDLMRKYHPFLTSGDDYPLAIMIAKQTDNIAEKVEEIEYYYRQLNLKGLSKSNGLQFLSHILSLIPGSREEKIDRCISLYQSLKSEKIKVYPDYYCILGLLSFIADDVEAVTIKMKEIVAILMNSKHYKWISKQMMAVIAASLTVDGKSSNTLPMIVGVSVEVILEQIRQTIMIAVMAGTVAATTAASS